MYRRGKAEEWREKGHLITSDSFVHWSWLCLWMLVFPTETKEERPFRFAQMTGILEKFVLRCSSVVKRSHILDELMRVVSTYGTLELCFKYVTLLETLKVVPSQECSLYLLEAIGRA